MEKLYFDYYGWPYYWDDVSVWGINPRSSVMIGNEPLSENLTEILGDQVHGDPHLRSCRIVSGYALESEKTQFGHIEDFLIEEGSWVIRNLVVDAKKWWPHHPVMITTKSVHSVDWLGRCIKLDMSKKEIESSPEFG
jgi:hypothetical protein